MTDKDVTIADLRARLESFRAARGWNKSQPQHLAMSICIEAAELLEHFQWGDNEKAEKEEIENELADIINYCLFFANTMNIDISAAIERKLAKLDQKYPTTIFNNEHNPSDAYWDIKQRHRTQK